MKGNSRIIETLNELLASELGAISQYIVHSEMTANWDYAELTGYFKKRAIDEMKHAEALIERILFLEGVPEVQKPAPIHIGPKVTKMLEADLAAEVGAIRDYNDAIHQAIEIGDNGTRELLDKNLKDEEDHLDKIEARLIQIDQMGEENYLAQQIG